ncbi:hydroxymethylglutaryl-coenzyme A synthase C terminal-domain-containing protein [Aspergillus pseudotamarii]|uniref:Hydroxymethylglutaryl-CoA synthase n=1 Tax=Aspergillus pseudotamarii TaxID=132259 RepID=A0A5N6T9Y2_ASPPS|nr:hydroxymethylglutaryl-coenzyme A synthase C terminal-domain-containing protein [Aspergillus pseudotamarii]KAE8143184.1 hydroxymethylglutaryl-coenzyme A synthase C terminal-domain-containing protein [Aspergillus pseudotamarii]
MACPKNVGIKALEIYVPGQVLDQSEFESHQGVSAGKYTIGLGLRSMNFCTDREDVCSLALTAVASLLRKYSIDPRSVGRLEVGTESPIDKAKSVKTVLTQLFADNHSLEGADTVNACYGGTNALFNAINWVESRSWDGRDAIVVASDIAIYKEAAARPTGGAGCVAILVGPNAPIVAVPGLRGSYMTHAYDFYKPDMKSEYPLVNGHLSISCFLSALDGCYAELRKNAAHLANNAEGRHPEAVAILAKERQSMIDVFDFMAFHTPNCKLVSKSYGRLLFNDFLNDKSRAEFANLNQNLRDLSYEESLKSKELEKAFIELSKERFVSRVEPCIRAPSLCGNMYTASLYCSLISLLSHVGSDALQDKTIGLFSYGSGITSTLFTLQVVGDVSAIIDKINLFARLEARRVASPQEYEEACQLREAAYGTSNFTPRGDLASVGEGVYYLEHVDQQYQRTYTVKSATSDACGEVNGV